MKDNGFEHVSVNVNFDGSKYGVLFTIIEEDSVINEFRWARGDRIIDGI